jgi:ParB family chromosome partitioning protein
MPRKPPPLAAPAAPLPTTKGRPPRAGTAAPGAFGFEDGGGQLREVPIADVQPNPKQPRRTFDDTELDQLARTIDTLGLLFPPAVRHVDGGYEIVAGERRWRACKRLGHTTIPVLVVHPNVDAPALAMAVAENTARVPLNAWEEAQAFATLLDDSPELTQQELGRRIGKSQEDISNSVRLLNLPDIALKLLRDGELTKAHGKVLLSEPDHSRRAKLARQAARENWSVRRLSQELRRAPTKLAARRRPSADMTAAAERWTAALRAATGKDLMVLAHMHGFQLELGDAAAAREQLIRLGVPAEALDEPLG